jgi:hypothetical protein
VDTKIDIIRDDLQVIYDTVNSRNPPSLTSNTGVQDMAEAIRICQLPSPVLEAFCLKFEEYQLLGGTKPAGSLLRKHVKNNLLSLHSITEVEFRSYDNETVFQCLFSQFHARNSFAWNNEFKSVRLKKTRDYTFGSLRSYIEDFKFSL